jgi:hypothetical protein
VSDPALSLLVVDGRRLLLADLPWLVAAGVVGYVLGQLLGGGG